MFTHEQILQLKEQLDFKEYYGQYLQLQQRGSLLWSCCPFHSDNNPSLSIDEKTGIWRCWVEAKGGDCIDFEMQITGKSFTEAVLNIAKSQDIKIEISEELKKELEYKKAIYSVNNAVANLFQQALAQNKEGQEYVIKRNFSMDIIKQFKIGYIPKNQLHEVAPNIEPFLKEAGLTITNEYNTHNYFSTHRISLPFFDENGHIVGFSSRATNNDIKPKYLHSRTSKIFKKDELLYAYNFAKESIKQTKSVILVEGQIDCIRAHQYGIKDCVATCGLALSKKQINLLKNDVKNYYLVIEDKKGEEAIDRLYDIIVENNYWANVRLIKLYQGDEKCDLDEFLQTNGKGAFLDKIKHAPTYHEYKLIDSLKTVNYKTIDEKKFHIYNVRKYIAKITNPIDKKQYIELLAEKLELPENDVRKVIARAEQTDDHISVGNYDSRRITAQKYIIASFFSHFGVKTAYNVLHTKLKVVRKLDNFFARIYKKLIDVILSSGADADLMNIIHTTEVMTSEELNCLDDCYFKHDDYDYLEDDESELEEFILDQIENLK